MRSNKMDAFGKGRLSHINSRVERSDSPSNNAHTGATEIVHDRVPDILACIKRLGQATAADISRELALPINAYEPLRKFLKRLVMAGQIHASSNRIGETGPRRMRNQNVYSVQ